MPRPKKPPPETFVRRPRSERKGLAPEYESLARGETDRLFIPRPSDPERVRDPRDGYAIKGVANRDARAVYDTRLSRLHALLGEEAGTADAAELAAELCDWTRLSLWRARRVTSFRSFAEDVLGRSEEELAALSARGAESLGVTLEPLSERTLALWLRLEAGMLEADPEAHARLDRDGRFVLRLALDPAPAAVAAASVRVSPMSRARRASGARERTSQGRSEGGSAERAGARGPRQAVPGGDRPPRRQRDAREGDEGRFGQDRREGPPASDRRKGAGGREDGGRRAEGRRDARNGGAERKNGGEGRKAGGARRDFGGDRQKDGKAGGARREWGGDRRDGRKAAPGGKKGPAGKRSHAGFGERRPRKGGGGRG